MVMMEHALSEHAIDIQKLGHAYARFLPYNFIENKMKLKNDAKYI